MLVAELRSERGPERGRVPRRLCDPRGQRVHRGQPSVAFHFVVQQVDERLEFVGGSGPGHDRGLAVDRDLSRHDSLRVGGLGEDLDEQDLDAVAILELPGHFAQGFLHGLALIRTDEQEAIEVAVGGVDGPGIGERAGLVVPGD